MRYFFLDENDRNKMDEQPNFVMGPVPPEEKVQSGDEDDLYQREYIAVSSSERTFFARLGGFITAPVLYKSERYLGFFSEEAWEKVLDEIKHLGTSEARKLNRFFVQSAELQEQSEVPGKYNLSMHCLQFAGYADYPGRLRGYQMSDGVYVVMKEDETIV